MPLPDPDPELDAPAGRRRRGWLWAQLVIGWLPVWALFTLLMAQVHGTPGGDAALAALRLVVVAALLGLVVQRLALRWPWPYPWRWGFALRHALAAPLYALAWLLLNSLWASLLVGRLVLVIGPGLVPFFVTGLWFYVMVAGVSYAHRAAERLAQVQAARARAQMAMLQAQLRPHFLFNALHTVVQLIPLDPPRAVSAVEQLAALLRASLAEQGDEAALAAQWQLVQRYLALEQLRLADRLIVDAALDPATLAQPLPSFALQTLVENVVRHAVEPSIVSVRLALRSGRDGAAWWLEVSDDGAGAAPAAPGAGSGLARLRERLAWRHGASASLQLASEPGRGFSARLVLPWRDDAGAGDG